MKGGGKRAAQVKAAAANKMKWREESQEAREALDAGAQSFGGSPDGTMFSAIPRLQLNLREFWRKHKQDFSDYWTRLPDAEKRGFLLASSPYMTEAGGLQPTDVLMPEINVFNLKANLLQLMEYRATTDVEDQESQDYDMIAQLESTGLLPNFPTQKNEVYCPAQRQSYVIEDTKNAKVKEFLAKGWFIDMKFWLPLATRQFYTLQHLTLFADDYRREVLGKNGYKMAMGTAHVCKVCQAKTKPDGGVLLQCSRCRSIKYCSAACQRKDWPIHKPACIPHP